MEELNKNQIVLLTLLVSFVTSIATGIVTVTLMDQAPPQVTQTINRVVERTIERAVPGETKIETVVKEVPVVVTEDKLIVDVINNASPGAVRITNAEGNSNLGTGFIISQSGLVVTAEVLLRPLTTENERESAARSLPVNYQVYINNNQSFPAKLVETGAEVGVALLQIDLGTASNISELAPAAGGTVRVPTVLQLTKADILPGQTIVALGLPDADASITVSGGLVSSVYTESESVGLVRTTAANNSNLGGPLLNTDGEVIGLVREVGLALNSEMIQQAIAGIGT